MSIDIENPEELQSTVQKLCIEIMKAIGRVLAPEDMSEEAVDLDAEKIAVALAALDTTGAFMVHTVNRTNPEMAHKLDDLRKGMVALVEVLKDD